MEFKPWMNYITPNDMPNDDLKYVAEVAGIKSALALMFCSPGLCVAIPQDGFRLVKYRYIVNNYDGTKYMLNKLAVDCGLCQRSIYNILAKYSDLKTK